MEHVTNIQKVCERLLECGLRVKKEKYKLLQDKIEVLDFVIDKDGLHKSKSKIEAMINAPQPKNKKEQVLSILLFFYFQSLTSVKDLGRKKIDVLQSLQRLEALELGECSDFSDQFGTIVLTKLKKLEKLRLEKGQGTCCTFDILEGISKMQNLTQLELVNFDVKNGFDKYLAACKNLKRLLIIPTYVSQSATSNNMILGGVTQLSNNLTHFVWGVTQELLKVTLLFVDQCNQMSKQITGDSIPVLKPVPCLELIEDLVGERNCSKGYEEKSSSSNPQVEILPLPHLQKLLLTALPKTRVKILKIPFYATWRQSISDSTSQ
ncbi:uncharacterized protein LOC106645143 [Copidosoma floridanum]|uniref:uncharacterized protein LOC106645143 n=1 Tax=Copidosoma floridanum TaxID=29053 RepID=UPI0006C95314|nr:uncharacterized protein LOC106645143 [Copidosoma floridanum]